MKKKQENKKQKTKAQKKNKIIENKGITGLGTDYTVYIMTIWEKFIAFLTGFAVGGGAGYLYFNNVAFGIVTGTFAAFKSISIYRNKLFKKRKDDLRIQFRDMLESLSNSYTVGMTANRAFHSAYSDMVTEHGKDSYIARELQLICVAHDNQEIEIRDMMNDFAQRSGIDDIVSFASVFDVSTNLGGDIAKVIRETRDMIGDKIEIELEIQTMVTSQKNELNILAIMPVVMALLTRSFNTGSGGALVVMVKAIALVLFIFAYWLGTKIVDIKM